MLQICKGASCLEAALIQEMRKKKKECAGQKDCEPNAEALNEKSECFKNSVWKYVRVNRSEQGRGRGEDTDTWEGISHSLLTWSGPQFLHVNTLGGRC